MEMNDKTEVYSAVTAIDSRVRERRRALIEPVKFNFLLAIFAVSLFALWHLLTQSKLHSWNFDWMFHWERVREALFEVPHEIAIALVIAVVLNIFVDRIHEKRKVEQEREFDDAIRHQQRAADSQMQKQREDTLIQLKNTRDQFENLTRQSILKAVFRENLPHAVVEQIEQQLFKPTLYRPTTDVTYWLEIRKGHERLERYAKYYVETRYTLYNPSSAKVPYDVSVEIDVPSYLPEEAKINFLSVRKVDIDISKLVTSDPDRNYKRLKYPVELQPDERMEVVIATEGAGTASSFEVFTCMQPCERLSVTCEFNADEVNVIVFSLHPSPPCSDLATKKRLTSYLLGVLPGQGIGLKWDPKEL